MAEVIQGHPEDRISFEPYFEAQFAKRNDFYVGNNHFKYVEVLPENEFPKSEGEFNNVVPSYEYGNNRPPILIVPGFISGPEAHKGTIHHFTEAGRRVICLETIHLGPGDVNGHHGPRAIAQKAAGVNGLIDGLGYRKLDIVTHSEGFLALVYAAKWRQDDVIRNVVSFAPAGITENGRIGDYANAAQMIARGAVQMMRRKNRWAILRATGKSIATNLPGTVIEGITIPQTDGNEVVGEISDPERENQVQIAVVLQQGDHFLRAKKFESYMGEKLKDGDDPISPYYSFSTVSNKDADHHGLLVDEATMDSALEILDAMHHRSNLPEISIDNLAQAAGLIILNRGIDAEGLERLIKESR